MYVVSFVKLVVRYIESPVHTQHFLLRMELFEHANQIVACPITRVAHWSTSAYVDAN